MLLLSLTPPNALPLRLAPSGAKGTAPVCAEDGLGGGSLALRNGDAELVGAEGFILLGDSRRRGERAA